MNIVLDVINAFNRMVYSELEIGLSQYMSRTRPNRADTCDENSLYWRYIVVDNRMCGSIWLEKEDLTARFATLGIFISSQGDRGNGIGSFVINEAIQEAKKSLAISSVVLRVRANNLPAYHCYLKCGFVEKKRFIKSTAEGEIEVIYMVKNIS